MTINSNKENFKNNKKWKIWNIVCSLFLLMFHYTAFRNAGWIIGNVSKFTSYFKDSAGVFNSLIQQILFVGGTIVGCICIILSFGLLKYRQNIYAIFLKTMPFIIIFDALSMAKGFQSADNPSKTIDLIGIPISFLITGLIYFGMYKVYKNENMKYLFEEGKTI